MARQSIDLAETEAGAFANLLMVKNGSNAAAVFDGLR